MPKTQTKEEIEADLHALRKTELTEHANALALQLMATVEDPTDCVMIAGLLLGAVMGNSAVLDEDSAKTLFSGVFKHVETTARSVMTRRANIDAVSKIFGGDR